MTVSYEIIFLVFLSYITGSFPSAIWIGKSFYKIDVREYGSGNSGATNTFRVLGYKAGVPVFLIDVFKGWISVKYASFFLNKEIFSSENFFELQLAMGAAAVIGHLFPIFTAFRGGKGIATMLGLLLAIHPFAALISFSVFILVVFIFRYVSLASLIAAFVFPLLIIFFFQDNNSSLILFSCFIPIVSLITHQKNIERLFCGEETKIKFGKKS